jgi:hypothetical protein
MECFQRSVSTIRHGEQYKLIIFEYLFPAARHGLRCGFRGAGTFEFIGAYDDSHSVTF